jgi:acyl-CoA synthetase (NDP forming)
MGLNSLISPSNVAVLGASNRVGSVGVAQRLLMIDKYH